MTESREDVLVKIPDEDLHKLATLYEEKCISWAPHMVNFIHTTISWKKFEKYRDDINIWSPYNSWEKDGTIIAILKGHRWIVILFTLSHESTNIYTALMQTELIDYSKRVIFYGIHEKHSAIVFKYLEDKKINTTLNFPNYMYTISPKEGKNLSVNCPAEVYLKKMELSSAKQINDAWPHKFEGSQDYISRFIEVSGGWGVFLKSTNEMVAWAMRHAFGELGMVQTEEKYKRRGYGSSAVKALTKEIAEEDHWPFGNVLLENYASANMFEKMGFKNIGICYFITIVPTKQ